MRNRHVVATLAVLGLGGCSLFLCPLPGHEPVGRSLSLLLAGSLGLWVTSRITSRLGPWRGAFVGWLVGVLVSATADLGVAAYELLDGREPTLLGRMRHLSVGWQLLSYRMDGVIFGAALFTVQLAPRSAAAWRRLLVALIAPYAFMIGWILSGAWLSHTSDLPLLYVAIVVTVIGCARGTDHPSDVLRPFRRLAQRLAGLEPRDPEFDLDAVEPLGGRRRERA